MPSPFEPLRTRDLRRIHTGQRFLHLDDDAYRDLLERLTGQRSAADLNAQQRRAVLDEFHRRGFKPPDHRRLDRRVAGPGKTRLMDKIEALLADAGRPWAYVDGIVKRMFDLEAIRFCDDQQLRKIVAALVYDQQRRQRRTTNGEQREGRCA
jgi:phage gp16-like protein